jgi:hypothetical protein
MEAMAQEWTEGRLDELSAKVDSGFARIDGDFRGLRLEMRTEFTALRTEMSAMQRTMAQGFIGLVAVMLAGFSALAGLIAVAI